MGITQDRITPRSLFTNQPCPFIERTLFVRENEIATVRREFSRKNNFRALEHLKFGALSYRTGLSATPDSVPELPLSE